jgi:hypothetical protein
MCFVLCVYRRKGRLLSYQGSYSQTYKKDLVLLWKRLDIYSEARSWNAQVRARKRQRTVEVHEDADNDED